MVKCHIVPVTELEILLHPHFTALNLQNSLICLIVHNHKSLKHKQQFKNISQKP